MDTRNKYGHATMVYNNKSKRSGMILDKWNYVGCENDWKPTMIYYLLMSGGRYKYVIEEDLNRLYTEVKPD